MAVITLDLTNNSLCVLVEKTDLVHVKTDDEIEVSRGAQYVSGKIFANGEYPICIVRGERQ